MTHGAAHAPITGSVDIDAPIGFAWHVLVSPDTVPLYMGALEYGPPESRFFYVQTDPAKRAAGDRSGATYCEIAEMIAPERFLFAWFIAPGRPLVVEFTLARNGENSRLSVAVHGFQQYAADEAERLRSAHETQWLKKTLPALKAAAEHAKSDPVGAGLAAPDSP